MKRVFDSPFLNKAALVLIWLLLMGGTFFYANKNYFLYHENPNLIKADGYYLYNFGSPRHYYWALPVKFTHEGKVYHSLHIAKLNGRICGAKRSHSVFEQPNCYQSSLCNLILIMIVAISGMVNTSF